MLYLSVIYQILRRCSTAYWWEECGSLPLVSLPLLSWKCLHKNYLKKTGTMQWFKHLTVTLKAFSPIPPSSQRTVGYGIKDGAASQRIHLPRSSPPHHGYAWWCKRQRHNHHGFFHSFCEEVEAAVADMQILAFCEEFLLRCTVLGYEHRSHYRMSGSQATLRQSVQQSWSNSPSSGVSSVLLRLIQKTQQTSLCLHIQYG